MTDFHPRILGSLREEDGRGVIHVEDVYATGIDDLWSAITEPDRLARWLATVTPVGELRVGGQFAASFTSNWDGMGRVEVCEAPHRLRVTTWSEDDDPTVMEATLAEVPGGTLLAIEERGLPLATYYAHGAGWQAHIEDLAAHIAGREPSNWGERWNELAESYRELEAANRP